MRDTGRMRLAQCINALGSFLGMRDVPELTQAALAEQLNVSRQAVSCWEVGSALTDEANVLQLNSSLISSGKAKQDNSVLFIS